MAKVPTKSPVQYTLRMEPDLYEEVKVISKLSRSPMSKVILKAVRDYTARERLRLRRSLKDTLSILDSYAERDPEYVEAIQMIADAETSDANPVEGVFFREGEADKEAPKSNLISKLLEDA